MNTPKQIYNDFLKKIPIAGDGVLIKDTGKSYNPKKVKRRFFKIINDLQIMLKRNL